MSNLAKAVQQLQTERDQARRRVEQLDEALKALGSLGGLRGRVGRVEACSDAWQEAENHVSGGAQANCSGSACALGEMESSQAKQIREDNGYDETTDDADKSSEGVCEQSKSEESSAPFARLILHVRTLSAHGERTLYAGSLRSR